MASKLPLFLSFALTALFPNSAIAQSGNSAILGLKSVEIIKGWRQADGTHMAAAHIKLEKGWKTYWRVAGGGGVPPIFDWRASTNIKSASIQWPAPSVFDDYGVRTIGYKNELLLPIILTPKVKGSAMRVDANLDFGVCDDVCVPVQTNLTADLPQRAAVGKSIIKAGLKNLAISGKSAGINSISCAIKPSYDGFEINATVAKSGGFDAKSIVVVEYPTNDWLNQGATSVAGNSVSATAILYTDAPTVINRSKIRVTVLTQGRAIEMSGCSAPS